MVGRAGQRAVVVRAAAEAEAALRLAAGRGLTLLSAPGAAGFLGASGWRALVARAASAVPGAPFDDILCCGAAPGYVLGALRAGCRILVLDSAHPAFAAVEAACAEFGATLLAERPPALDLHGVNLRKPKGEALLARWLDEAPMT